MNKQMNLMVRLNVPIGISGLKIAEILQKLIEIGVSDARETVKSGEGDQQEARAASCMTVESITELKPYALDGKCHNAEPGTYGHECGKPATWLGVKTNGFASGFCDHCKEHGWEAKPFTKWTQLPKPSEFISVQDAWEAAGGNPGIHPTRDDLLLALRTLDQVCDEAQCDGQN